MKIPLQCLVGLLLSVIGISEPVQAQRLDPTFGPFETWQPSKVFSTEEQADGKVLIAGPFTRVGGRAATGLARLNADGTLDEAFTKTAAVESDIWKVRQLANGRVLVSGYRQIVVAGRTYNGLALLNENGTPVAGFSPELAADNYIVTLAVQADNKILLAGFFSNIVSGQTHHLVRLNADGSLDKPFMSTLGTSFVSNYTSSPYTNNQVTALLVQPDKK